MKKLWAMALLIAMASCNNDANDADPNTDTTNFNTSPADTGSLSPAVGDTAMKMDPSTGTDTTSRPHSGTASGTSSESRNAGSSDTGSKK